MTEPVPFDEWATRTWAATAEPERDHTARATPLPAADETWLYKRAAMLDVTIRRESTRLLRLLDEIDAIHAELWVRGQGRDGTADLQTYLSEETTER